MVVNYRMYWWSDPRNRETYLTCKAVAADGQRFESRVFYDRRGADLLCPRERARCEARMYHEAVRKFSKVWDHVLLVGPIPAY